MSPTIHPVILCGGSGTRLWPVSRKAKPKPFLPLLGERTLFQEALDRVADRDRFAAPVVVTGADHLPFVEEQSSDAGALSIIVEPAARNTAPAIAIAAARLPEDGVLLVCPSDHHIADPAAFATAAQAAARLAADDRMTAFGIAADRPETGYGYIRRGVALEGGYAVDAFVEKPVEERARAFVADERYSWNGGIFAFRAGALLDELRGHRPAMARAVEQAVRQGREDGARFHPDPEAFAAIEGESIDYAVMENTARAAMVPVAMGWSDIGNWAALHKARPRDAEGNSVRARQAELVDCRNVAVESDGPRVSVIGLENAIVVVNDGEVLVTTADGAQMVGKLEGAAKQ